MNRITVIGSSSIKSVGYDAASKMLEIEFSQGTVYQYPDVPQEVYNDFAAAESAGSFFHANIKSQYVGTKVQPDE